MSPVSSIFHIESTVTDDLWAHKKHIFRNHFEIFDVDTFKHRCQLRQDQNVTLPNLEVQGNFWLNCCNCMFYFVECGSGQLKYSSWYFPNIKVLQRDLLNCPPDVTMSTGLVKLGNISMVSSNGIKQMSKYQLI